MRTLPIDAAALRMLATGEVQPVAVWAELSDGSRRPVPDAQEKDPGGMPLWTVTAIVPPAQEGDRSELLQVRVGAWEKPTVQEFAPVRFDGLVCRVSVNKRTGQLGQYWEARGLVGIKAAEKAA